MKYKLFSFLAVAVLAVSCSDPDAWDDEKKQIVKDKCDSEVFDCDCFLETTISEFPKAQDYNKTLENESSNQEKVDAYWDKLYDECMTE
ncbi:MAG: hypothetical protein P8P74_13980 [Crocinitomicaceae bacterium]|nr:hypothetical protein [Crocinitomicaceae bacterium]